MNSQDQQDNSQNRLPKLPIELHHAISSYLSTLNIKHLSQSSVELRSSYHPILYRNCKVNDRQGCEIISKRYWIIRSWVLFEPSKYSWFPNQAVQSIVVNNQFSIIEFKYFTKPSDYPSLVSFKVVPETYRSQLVITQQNHASFIERDMKFPHLSTNDFMPIFKLNNRVLPVKCSTNPGSYYVLQCNSMETRSMITSLNLNFQEAVEDDDESEEKEIESSWQEEVVIIAKELKAYANLKDLKIWCSDRYNYETFEALIDSVTKLESLDSLMIHHRMTKKDTPHLNVLDNLQGSWKTFNLCLGFDRRLSTSDMFLRLPTVTNLMLLFDECFFFTYEYFEGKFEFGSNIRQLTFPFHSAGEFLSEYHRVQNVLDNLTTLKVVFPPDFDSRFYEEDVEMVVFTKVLPNLRAFEIQMQNFYIMPRHQLDGFPELSKTFFSLIPFGEFDILNYESIKPYILELKKDALGKWGEREYEVKIINSCVESLENANKDSNIYELYCNLFSLQFLHSAFKCKYTDKKDATYSKHRAIISVLLLRLLQYTPNLETLTLLGVPLHEEFAAFHRLVKYHKHLKTVSTRMIFKGDMSFAYHENYDIYSRYSLFAKLVRHQIHDSQVFFTKCTESWDDIFDLEGVEYDIEGFRKDYAFDFSSDHDKDFDMYKFGQESECIFTESLPLNINEVKEYINRQDLLKRCYDDEKYLCPETFSW